MDAAGRLVAQPLGGDLAAPLAAAAAAAHLSTAGLPAAARTAALILRLTALLRC